MKANVAWSINEDAREAGKACAKKAVLDLVQTKIAFLFSSERYNTENLLKGAKEALGTAPIIGGTSKNGIIVPDGFITSKKGFAGMMAIGDEDTAIGTAISEKEDSARETGRKVAKIARDKINKNESPAYFFMIATPGEEEEYLKGIQDEIGDVPCFGGSASDEENSKDYRIYTEDGITNNGVAVAFFYTNKYIKNITNGRYHETIHSGVITKIEGNRTIEKINDIDALKLYAEWTGEKTRNLKNEKLKQNSILKPLGVKQNDNYYIIKEPIKGNADYSINVSNDIYVNEAIVQMQLSKEEIANSNGLMIRELNKEINDTDNEKKAKAYLIMTNANRIETLQDLDNSNYIEELVEKLKKETNNLPFIMMLSSGEYGRFKHSQNFCSNLVISSTAFAE